MFMKIGFRLPVNGFRQARLGTDSHFISQIPLAGLISGRAIVLLQDAEEDQQQGAKSHEVYPEAALARIVKEQERDTISALDHEKYGEGNEEEIVSLAPEAQEEHSRRERERCNHSEHERYDHV
jgi:hypothetical protein